MVGEELAVVDSFKFGRDPNVVFCSLFSVAIWLVEVFQTTD